MAGMVPILLLDEIAAHLDAGRRAALFSIIEDLGGQTFMTGTDAALFSSLEGRAQFLTVGHGAVSPTEGY
jgi:DNA replication and repair protein RecF